MQHSARFQPFEDLLLCDLLAAVTWSTWSNSDGRGLHVQATDLPPPSADREVPGNRAREGTDSRRGTALFLLAPRGQWPPCAARPNQELLASSTVAHVWRMLSMVAFSFSSRSSLSAQVLDYSCPRAPIRLQCGCARHSLGLVGAETSPSYAVFSNSASNDDHVDDGHYSYY